MKNVESWAVKIFKIFSHTSWTLGVAESCTGGQIAVQIASVPGVSKFFNGAIISYSNQAKQDLLNVSPRILENHGAVSRPTVLAMAHGARKKLKVTWSLAVTGIAGPSGGTKTKPVGLVFFAVVGPGVAKASRKIFKGNRHQIQRQAAQAAAHLLIQTCQKKLRSAGK